MVSPQSRLFFVLTGGPGSGKSTLIDALSRAGHRTFPEAGRAIIQDQVARGGRALPWVDPLLFAEMMLSWDLNSYHLAEPLSGPVFFDRGIVDVIGYLQLMHLPVPAHMRHAAQKFRYNRVVFVAPPWQEIFKQDRERKQDFEEAKRTCEAVTTAYSENGYELIELPRSSVEKRVTFVLEKAKAPDKSRGPGRKTVGT